jgi:Trp operon repressor
MQTPQRRQKVQPFDVAARQAVFDRVLDFRICLVLIGEQGREQLLNYIRTRDEREQVRQRLQGVS